MANAKRAANRARGGASGQAYGPESFTGPREYGSKTFSTGSHAHVGERRGVGPRDGAGELGHIHQEPGPASRRVRFRPIEDPSTKKNARGGPTVNRTRGREEDMC